jgi:MYXO-CTERM domain-containing protein
MRTAPVVVLSLALTLWAGARPAAANVCGPVPHTLILLDRSGSMKQLVGPDSKWSIAKSAVNNLTATFAGQLDFGLMLFSRWPHVSNCSSGKVNVGVGPNTAGAISGTLSSAYPDGDTPIALSLDEARVYLQQVNSGKPQYVILVTDGMETCQPASVNSPPAAAGKLLANGVKTYVVGFGSAVDPSSLTATAQSGGTGNYYQADNLTQLNTALKKIAADISCCGDGKLDPGEACDTAIPAGAPGSCPTSCNDGNPCTKDMLTGTACNTACSFFAIITPINGDGCCPPGASSQTDSDCPASCGNGVLDPGEKCDTGIPAGQWGGCPTTCDDKNPCTTDTLVGSGCNAYCTHQNICPTNNCGNGVVDAGEWCDTAIPAGQPGSCPTNCDDKNPCTVDTLMGSACLAKCSHVPITQPANGDGCCPPGASSANDSDCSSTCGNGVIDPGEACDPGIQSGPGSCTMSCDDQNPCTKDFLGGGACNPKCMHSALPPDPTKKDGCCPDGMTSNQDADCLPPCGPDSNEANCTNPCENVTCPDGEYCNNGQCLPWPSGSDPTENPTGLGANGGDTVGGCECRTSTGAAEGGLPAILLLVLLGVALRRRPR